MSHLDNSGSEDGQLRSPTGDDYYRYVSIIKNVFLILLYKNSMKIW